MARRSKGTEETQPGEVIYTHDDKVKFKVAYPKDYPAEKKHLKEGSTIVIHQKHAEGLAAKGLGTITEFLNDKRDKSLDEAAKKGNLKAKTSGE